MSDDPLRSPRMNRRQLLAGSGRVSASDPIGPHSPAVAATERRRRGASARIVSYQLTGSIHTSAPSSIADNPGQWVRHRHNVYHQAAGMMTVRPTKTERRPSHPENEVTYVTISRWPARRWAAAVLAGGVVALFVGIPTGIIRTPFYHRMTPVLWWNYPVWAITAVLGGLIFATYVRSTVDSRSRDTGTSIGGSTLSLLAVGCPICNKVVVAAVGVSGALNLWAPLQPILGVISLAPFSAPVSG